MEKRPGMESEAAMYRKRAADIRDAFDEVVEAASKGQESLLRVIQQQNLRIRELEREGQNIRNGAIHGKLH